MIAVFVSFHNCFKHPHFGLDCFWVAQNASQKMGIRLLPTIASVLKHTNRRPSQWMAFAVAAMLRFLTPQGDQPQSEEGVYAGQMDVPPAGVVVDTSKSGTLPFPPLYPPETFPFQNSIQLPPPSTFTFA